MNSNLKYLLLLFIISFNFTLCAQLQENTFKKTSIEIDGEEIFDVYKITQDHQGFIWMSTNLGLIRYDGIEGKKYEFSNCIVSAKIELLKCLKIKRYIYYIY